MLRGSRTRVVRDTESPARGVCLCPHLEQNEAALAKDCPGDGARVGQSPTDHGGVAVPELHRPRWGGGDDKGLKIPPYS